jgi:hypothetical protein
MNKPLTRCAALLLGWSYLSGALAENEELWDLYPSRIEVAQYELGTVVKAAGVSWYSHAEPDDSLAGMPVALTVTDAEQNVAWEPSETAPFNVTAGKDWQWRIVFSDGFARGDCAFAYSRELGAVLLPTPEGYRLAQRETLAWTGPDLACPGLVENYIKSSFIAPVMPFHMAAWQSIGGAPETPAATGRFEFTVVHELRRTRRLLPLEVVAEVQADPFMGLQGSPGDGPERFALIAARLGPTMLRDGFEP